jgi:hypothetical protein
VSRTIIVNTLLIGAGGIILFSSEANCMRAVVLAVTEHPGLWRGWIGTFIGVILIIVPGTFLLTRRFIVSPHMWIRRCASVLRWVVVVAAVLGCGLFGLLNIRWGISTDWTFGQ